MTGNDQVETATTEEPEIVFDESSKAEFNDSRQEEVEDSKQSGQKNDEVEEEITEEGTVNSKNPEFFEDLNPFEAEKCRIEILNLPLGYENSQELLEIFSKYGKVSSIEFKTLKCVHGFIQFQSEGEMLAALKAEDRREMPEGFKLNLVDEFTRNEERKTIKNATIVAEKKRNIDNSKRNVRDRNPKPRNNSRKRSLSPPKTYSRRDSPKRSAPRGPFDILIIGLGDVLNSFVEAVEDKCLDMRFRPDVAYLDYRDDVKGKILSFQQSASLGCFAVLFCERKREDSRNVSMQLFSIQGTRDYENLSQSEVFALLNKERQTRTSVQGLIPQSVPNALMVDPQRLLIPSFQQPISYPPFQVQGYNQYGFQVPNQNVGPFPTQNVGAFPAQNVNSFQVPASTFPTQNVGNLLSQLSSVQDLLKQTTNQGRGR